MFSQFIVKKLSGARYKLLGDGSYFGEIPGMRGVWANAKNLEACRRELQEVLEEWIILKVRDGDLIPGFQIKHLRTRIPMHA